VLADRALADAEPRCDVSVGQPARDACEHDRLARREPRFDEPLDRDAGRLAGIELCRQRFHSPV